MHEKDAAAREKQFDEGRRFIDLAHAMGVKYVRMFGDKIPEGEPRDEVVERVADGFQLMAEHAGPAGVTVLIESHGDFTKSADLETILTRVGSPHFALLWDAHHSFVAGREQPADTFARLGKWVRHTHLKDSVPAGADRRYVLVGAGEVPVAQQVKVLAAGGYQGFYSFEWEKKWQPAIEDPEIAFPHYAKTMAEYLGGRREASVGSRSCRWTSTSAGGSSSNVAGGSPAPSRRSRRAPGRGAGAADGAQPCRAACWAAPGRSVSILAMGCGSRFLAVPGGSGNRGARGRRRSRHQLPRHRRGLRQG